MGQRILALIYPGAFNLGASNTDSFNFSDRNFREDFPLLLY